MVWSGRSGRRAVFDTRFDLLIVRRVDLQAGAIVARWHGNHSFLEYLKVIFSPIFVT